MTDIVKEKMNPDLPFGMKYIHPDFRIGCDEFTLTQAEEGLRAVHVLDQFVWIRVMEGQLSFEVNMQEITLSTGDTLFINSRVPHICRTVIAAPARVRILIAAPDAVHVSYLENMLTGMINDGGFASVVIHPVSDLFSSDMDTIYELSRHRPEGFEFEVAARYLSLLRQYFRIYHHTNPEETVRHDTDMESFREMLAFIGEHHQEEITLDEIAAIGRMSRSKCSRMFRRYLGKSPIEHVQKYRLEKSVFLLKNTDLQFSEIASVCGFNQQSYFNRLFVREYGVTPRQMRREFKKSSGE
jgi:AraC-like DNA-binding protein